MTTMTERVRIAHVIAGLIAAYLFFLASVSFSSDQVPGKLQQRPVAIVGATIHTVSGQILPDGMIIFDKGIIVAVGQDLPLPANGDVIAATGKHVYPGLFGADSYLGLTEIDAVRASNDMEETGTINPNVRAETAVNPESELIPVTRANGVTTVVSEPSGGVISGTSAVLMMDGWTWEEMTLKAPAAMNINWPSMVVQRGPWVRTTEEEQKKQREKELNELFDAFRDARAYRKARAAMGTNGLPYHNTDLRWEALVPVLERKIPVVVWAEEVQQIQAAVAWAVKENLQLIIGGGNDAWRVADILKQHDVPVIISGVHRLPDRRFEGYDTPFSLPQKLHQAGVRFAIAGDRGESSNQRNLPYQAATAVAYGLPQEEALKAITLYPAQIFGVADRVGSLDPGKDATLIVTSGDPLEVTTQVEIEFIQGRKVDLTSKHTMLYEKYKEKYQRRAGTANQK